MPPADFLTEICGHLPAVEAQAIINRLRIDALVWNSLQAEEFAEKAIQIAGADLLAWSPARIARLALGDVFTQLDNWKLKPEESQLAAQMLKEAVRDHRVPINLKEAGYLAAALLERWKETDSLINLLESNAGEPENQLYAIWKTPLACLYGMLPDPMVLLRALLPKKTSILSIAWISHCVLCNPIEPLSQVQILANLMVGFSPIQQINWLRYLQLAGHTTLVTALSNTILARLPVASASQLSKHCPEKADVEVNIVRLLELMRMVGLYRYSGQTANARIMVGNAHQLLRYLIAGVEIQSVALDLYESQTSEVASRLSGVVEQNPESNLLATESLMELSGQASIDLLLNKIPEEISSPLIEIYRAKALFVQGSQAVARENAAVSTGQFIDKISHQPLGLMSQFLLEWQPASLIATLLEMGLTVEALRCTEKLLESRPLDIALLELAGDINQNQRQLPKALEYALLLQMLQPANPDRHRKTANLLEILGRWAQARQEREQVIRMTQPQIEDWVALGRCQLHLAEWDAVLTTCEKILNQSPENGKACAFKGQALLALGQPSEAVRLLNQATLLAPEEAEPWLAIFRMQKEAGDESRAIDTLKAAVLAVPDSADINFELAKIFLQSGLFSDGLPLLKKATKLAPDSVDVTLDLGKTLAALGHYEEARKVFEQGRQRWSMNAALAYAFAEIVLPFGEREPALQALEVALHGDESHPEWILLFAKTLTNHDSSSWLEPDMGRLITAQLGLERILAEQPNLLEASILKADVVMARGDYAQAYGLYQVLIENCVNQPSYRWRVQAGLGEAALHLGLVDNALAALKEAVQSQPDHPKLQRLLAEAYKKGNLGQEAVIAARYALKLNPDHLETLEWFGTFIAQLGEVQEAILALQTATQLAPEKSVYWIGLAELYLRQEDQPAAEDALNTLMGLTNISTENFLRTAKAFLTLGQPEKALECLTRAIKGEGNPDAQLWIELAYVCQVNQKNEQSLDALQQTMNRLPGLGWLAVFQSDLLVRLGRLDAAKACLERAQRMPASRSSRPITQSIKSGIIPAEWLETFQQPYAVDLRFALIERRKGNLAAALPYAEAALETRPEQIELHCVAADIAAALMLPQRAAQLADAQLVHQSPMVVDADIAPAAVVTLLCQLAEIAVDANDLDSCTAYIQKGESLQPNLQRLIAIKVRLAVRRGDWQSAVSLYKDLNFNAHLSEEAVIVDPSLAHQVSTLPGFWRAQTALDVMDWQNAIGLMRSLVRSFPDEPLLLLGLAKTFVLSAEAMQIGKDLKMITHLPSEDCMGLGAYETFEKTLNHLEALTNPLLVERWRARGRAAYRPNSATLRVLSDLLPGEQEAAALISALRASNNLSGAIQVAQDYPNSTAVLRQLALCHLLVDPMQGLKAANRAAELELFHPIHQAVLALALQKNGYVCEALEAWQTALTIWDNEPLWQAQAASMAVESGDLPEAEKHWECAANLDPTNLDFIVEQSKVYLAGNQSQKALDVLNRATEMNDHRSDLWFLTAQAFRQLNRLPNALLCAEKSVSLDPDTIQPMLLCGEITLQMGNSDLAFEFSNKALAKQPFNESAILFKVKVYESLGRADEGLTLLEKSITPDSSIVIVLEYARLVYQQRGPQAALPMLRKIAETDPNQVGVLNLLAHAQEECGELDGAEQTTFKALQIQPNQADLNRLMGRLKRIAGQLDQSVHFLSEAIRQEPGNMEAYIELGKTYQERREMAQALTIYEKAIQADSYDYRPYYLAGIVLRESKDYRGAETMLRRASELAPQDVNIRRLLGAVVTLNLIHNSQEVGTLNETL